MDAAGSSGPAAERARPRHLAADYAAQFADEEVAAAYQHRRPIPGRRSPSLSRSWGGRPRHVVELGAGTGDFTLGLAPRVDSLVAVEPSRAMLERGRRRTEGAASHVVWLPVAAEDYAFDRRCSAVVAAESFHWLDGHRVLPRIAEGLISGGFLILVERLVADRAQTEAVTHRQSVEGYVESFHSRNGFSRARLSRQRAREFDDKLKALVARHGPDGPDEMVAMPMRARVAWCRPAT